jgi:hypothetical protein
MISVSAGLRDRMFLAIREALSRLSAR